MDINLTSTAAGRSTSPTALHTAAPEQRAQTTPDCVLGIDCRIRKAAVIDQLKRPAELIVSHVRDAAVVRYRSRRLPVLRPSHGWQRNRRRAGLAPGPSTSCRSCSSLRA
jgi:hypothetical protein